MQKVLGSTAHRWLGWPGQKEGDSLDARRLGKGMFGILKIMTSSDNGSMKFITQSKLPECCRAPFEVSRWKVSKKKKKRYPLILHPVNLSHGLKWSPERFQIHLLLGCVYHQQDPPGPPKYWGFFLAAKHWAVGTVNLKLPLFSQFSRLAENFPFLTVLPSLLTLGARALGGMSLLSSSLHFIEIPLPHSARIVFILTFSRHLRDTDF